MRNLLQQVPSSLCSRPHLYRHNPGTALSQAREAQAEALSSHQWIGWDRRLPQTTCSLLTRVGTARLAATPVLRVRSLVRLTCRPCLLHRPRRLRQNEQARNLISFSINSIRSRRRFAYEHRGWPACRGASFVMFTFSDALVRQAFRSTCRVLGNPVDFSGLADRQPLILADQARPSPTRSECG